MKMIIRKYAGLDFSKGFQVIVDTIQKEILRLIYDDVNIRLFAVCLLFGLLPVAIGCSATLQKRSVTMSGFLKDYSQLRQGEGDEPLKIYVNREINFNLYDKVIVDPVSIIISEDSDMAKISADDRQKIADYFHAKLIETLSQKYIVTSKPGSLTMRVRFALTDIKESDVIMDTVSTVIPIGDIVSYAATGIHRYVGAVNSEMELLDSITGQRLAAAVDGRSGAKITGYFDKFNKWKDAKDACDYWAERLAQRLDEISAGDYVRKGH